MCTSNILLLTIISLAAEGIWAHGRMNDPPGRSTMWRMGYYNPRNYNDMEVYCGGLERLWARNHGRCGVCGDAFDLPEPRDNEAGGRYGNGIIVRSYQQGQVMSVRIQLTANHGGYFEFRLCPTNSPNVRATEECMNQFVLETDQGKTYNVVAGQKDYNIRVYLPQSVYCSQCVFRWKYYAAQHVGHGTRQEHFYSCADISIQRRPVTTTYIPWTPKPYTTTSRPWTPKPTPSIDSRPLCNSICIYYCRISKVVCSGLCKYCRLP